MSPQLVAGIDSSTQQTKLVVADAMTGELVHSSAAPHPDGTELGPEHWWSALQSVGGAHPTGAAALAIAAQQHTSIFLDEDALPVRPAILWNDLRASSSARDLREELGDQRWLSSLGLLPDAAHPVSKLRWLAEHEPDAAARIATVLLPHDWLTWKLLDEQGSPTTDRSDASTTGYWSPVTGRYLPELIEHSLGRMVRTPDVLAPDAIAGTTASGLMLAAGCGDNAATHLALDTEPGDVVISIGTSTTISMRTTVQAADPAGTVETMSDARTGFIPIVVLLNGARVIGASARLLRVTIEQLDALAHESDPEAAGALLLPHLDGERNPASPTSSGSFVGLSRRSMTPPALARATYLGLGCSIAEAFDALTAAHGAPTRAFVVGGGARSQSLRQTVADLIGAEVEWPAHREHAAFGAARQAAWALTGVLPEWDVGPVRRTAPSPNREWVTEVRERYRESLLM